MQGSLCDNLGFNRVLGSRDQGLGFQALGWKLPKGGYIGDYYGGYEGGILRVCLWPIRGSGFSPRFRVLYRA